MNEADQYRLCENKVLSFLDIHFARLMTRLTGRNAPELFLGAALVSSHTREGHICLDLCAKAGETLLEGEDGSESVVCPKLSVWQKKLRESSVVGKPGEYKPLILDDRSRLYLYRYWDYETQLAALIQKRTGEYAESIDFALLKEGLNRLFPAGESKETDWQKVAAFTALTQKFCVISGGPGTGKTTTVARILALLVEQATSGKLGIALAAPTGKAAARLQDAIRSAKKKLDCAETVKEAIPEEASTIHRLLGTVPGSPYFRHNAKNPLSADVVAVDEASMVDLALMSKLVQALDPEARLILLGDKDQLASVEAGAVLGDICAGKEIHRFSESFCVHLEKTVGGSFGKCSDRGNLTGIQDCIVELRKNYRFGSDSGIGMVSRTVNAGDGEEAVKLMANGTYSDILWKKLPRSDGLLREMKQIVVEGFESYLRIDKMEEIFSLFDRFRILCALREGPYGVRTVNALVERILEREKLIAPRKNWYRGRPVLITRNNYSLHLFNGDIGITLPDSRSNGDLRVFFPTADGTLRKFHPLRLPECETVYAMTVHKSQGSEFDKVLMLLSDRESPVLTRELIYTGITRARKQIEIWGNEEVFRIAVSRRTQRTSGLRDALWGNGTRSLT